MLRPRNVPSQVFPTPTSLGTAPKPLAAQFPASATVATNPASPGRFLGKAVKVPELWSRRPDLVAALGTATIPADLAWLEPYQRLFDHGIQSLEDVELADRFLLELGGEFAELVRATQSVPKKMFEIEEKDGSTGGTTLAATRLSYSQQVDRKSGDAATSLRIGRGLPLLGYVHDLVHSAKFSKLPEVYRQAFPDIPKNSSAPLYDIFHATLANFYWDEALAFSAEVRLVDFFREKTGVDLAAVSAADRQLIATQVQRKFYEAQSFEGVYRYVMQNPAYLPYKIMALQVAYLVKNKVTDLPKKEALFQSLGIREGESGLEVDYEKLSPFVQTLWQENQADAVLYGVGSFGNSNGRRLERAKRYFKGALDPDAAVGFLREDFEIFVQQLDNQFFEGRHDWTKNDPRTEITRCLPPLPRKPMRAGDAAQLTKRPSAVMDQVALLADLARSLEAVASLSDELVADHWDDFLSYAEAADPETAAVIYSKLIAVSDAWPKQVTEEWADRVLDKDQFELTNTLPRRQGRLVALGLSLERSGYRELGESLMVRGLNYFSEELLSAIIGRVNLGNKPRVEIFLGILDLKPLLEADRGDLVEVYAERFLDRVAASFPDAEARARDFSLHATLDIFSIATVKLLQALGPDWSRLSLVIRERLKAFAEKVWAVSRQRLQTKIRRYETVTGVSSWTSFDEILSHDSAKKIYRHCKEWALGLLEGMSEETSSGFLATCLKIPEMFSQTLGFLQEFPDSQQKMELFALAAAEFPENADPPLRKNFLEQYRKVFCAHEFTLKAWGFVERQWIASADLEFHRQQSRSTLFENSRDCFLYQSRQAEMLLKHPATRAQGLDRLRESWSEDGEMHFNPHGAFSEPSLYFQPALAKAEFLLDQFQHCPVSERSTWLARVQALLQKSNSGNFDAMKKAALYWRLARAAFEIGDSTRVFELDRIWKTEFQKIEAGIVAEDQDFHPFPHLKNLDSILKDFSRREHPQSLWKKSRKIYRDAIPQLSTLLQSETEVESWIQEIQAGVESGYTPFAPQFAVQLLQSLGRSSVARSWSSRDSLLQQFATLTIDLYLAKAVDHDVASSWTSLIDVLKDLPLSASIKNELFSDLILKASPEPGVMIDARENPKALWEVYQSFEFLIDNPDFSEAEALLLERIVDLAAHSDYPAHDPRSQGRVRGLIWLLKRFGKDHLLAAVQEPKLRALSSESGYQAQVSDLGRFRHVASLITAEEMTDAEFARRMSQADGGTLKSRQAAVQRWIFRDLKSVASDEGVVSPAELKNGGLPSIVQAWRDSLSVRDEALAAQWWSILVTEMPLVNVQLGQLLYVDLLHDASLSRKQKREVFEKLAEARVPSAYARQVWKRLVAKPGAAARERETWFYQAFNLIYDRPGGAWTHAQDFVFGKILHASRSEAKVLLATAAQASNIELLLDPNFDLLSETDWRAFVSYYQYPEIFLALNFGILALLQEEDSELRKRFDPAEKNFSACLQELKPQILRKVQEHFPHWDLPEPSQFTWQDCGYLFGKISSLPDPEQARQALERFQPFVREQRKAIDQCLADKLAQDMPALFQNRPPLTQFWLTRYYLTLPAREQQRVLRAMRQVKPAAALRVFLEVTGLEKIGQFLSCWPQVPEEVRRELQVLQDRNVATSREAFLTLLREQQARPSEWVGGRQLSATELQWVIDHLARKPLSSGTMADGFISELPDGTKVLVKGRTPVKARKFHEALERLRAVEERLSWYTEEELPGLRQSRRFAAMFFPMVAREEDFRNERRRGEKARAAMTGRLDAPEYFYASESVLVQEYVEGVRFDELDAEQQQDVAGKIRAWFYGVQIAKQGSAHTDLLPGNHRTNLKNGKIWILDYGQGVDVPDPERQQVLALFAAFAGENLQELVRVLEGMGTPRSDYRRSRLTHALRPSFRNKSQDLPSLIAPLLTACEKAGLELGMVYLELLKGIVALESGLSS